MTYITKLGSAGRNKNIKEKMQKSVLAIVSIFILFSTVDVWAFNSRIRLDNTSVESIHVNESFLSVVISHPGEPISGVCSIDIVADSYNRNKPIQNFIDELIVTNAFGPEEAPPRIEIVSDKTARFTLSIGVFVFEDGFVLRPKSESVSIKELIEKTLGKDRSVVVMPRSC